MELSPHFLTMLIIKISAPKDIQALWFEKKGIYILIYSTCMSRIVVLKGFFQDFDIAIIKYSNFESKKFQSI